MPMSDKTSLSRWLLAGTPSAIALGVFGVVVLHAGLKVPWKIVTKPVAIQIGIQMALYVVMFWIRARFQRSRDLRPTTVVFGTYLLIAGLLGMRQAGQLGVASGDVFNANCVPFFIFVFVVTTISVILFTFWRPE